jgi:hypothetical protein
MAQEMDDAMILEISKEERQYLLRALLMSAMPIPTLAISLSERLIELRDGNPPPQESGSPVGLVTTPMVPKPPDAGDGVLARVCSLEHRQVRQGFRRTDHPDAGGLQA